MLSYRPFLSTCLVLAVFVMLAGCGSVTHSNPGPTPTPIRTPPIPTPTPTPTPPGATPTPTPTPTPAPSSAITGRIVDPSGVPVVGTVVVALEKGPGDFSIFMETTADASGHFRFNNVPVFPTSGQETNAYAIMVAARAAHDPGTAPGSPGSFYAPALLLSGNGSFGPGDPIQPGTDVGTIRLNFTSQGDMEITATSTDSSGTVPVPIQVKIAPMRIFTLDFLFDYPWLGKAPTFNTAPGASCSAGTACGGITLDVVPESPVEEAVFSKAGNTFSPSQTAPNFELPLHAFSLLNGQPDCNPSEVDLFANTLHPDAATPVGPAAFTGCH